MSSPEDAVLRGLRIAANTSLSRKQPKFATEALSYVQFFRKFVSSKSCFFSATQQLTLHTPLTEENP